MSLTSLLDDTHGPVRQWFENRLPNLKPMQRAWKSAGPRTLLPNGAPMLGQIGTALDYRIRLWFERYDITSTTAAAGAWSLYGKSMFGGASPFHTVVAAFDAFLDENDPCGRLLDPPVERELAGFCFILALYEVHRRSMAPTPLLGLAAKPSWADFQPMLPQASLDDLYALTAGFAGAYGPILHPSTIVLNPTFHLSGALGGADADLILDYCLIDIKTGNKPLDRPSAYQLLGYLLADSRDDYSIDHVGFYVARVPKLIMWSVAELLNDTAGRTVHLDGLREEFGALLLSQLS